MNKLRNALKPLYQIVAMLAAGVILGVVLLAVATQIQPDVGAYVDTYLVNIKAEISADQQ